MFTELIQHILCGKTTCYHFEIWFYANRLKIFEFLKFVGTINLKCKFSNSITDQKCSLDYCNQINIEKTTCYVHVSVYRQTVKKKILWSNVNFECNHKFIFLFKHVHCSKTSKLISKNVKLYHWNALDQLHVI